MTADLKAFLLNCFVGGETASAHPEGGWIRNKIELSLGGYDIKILQRPWVINAKLSEYRGQAVDTTTVIVSDVELEQREEVLELLQGLSYLLSFATYSDVALRGWEHLDEHPDNEPWAENWAVVARTGYFRPTFDIRDGKEIRVYLENTCESYFRFEEIRKLRVAIDLLVSAETLRLPLELRLTTLFVLLENLKSTFAQEQGYPFKKGYYRKSSGGKLFFATLLAEMFEKVKMDSPDLSAIKKLRNEIIHSGISQTPYDYQEEIYDSCQDLIREYLLRLLGYTGPFRLYSGRGMTLKEI